jgi:hypothetical protein
MGILFSYVFRHDFLSAFIMFHQAGFHFSLYLLTTWYATAFALFAARLLCALSTLLPALFLGTRFAMESTE